MTTRSATATRTSSATRAKRAVKKSQEIKYVSSEKTKEKVVSDILDLKKQVESKVGAISTSGETTSKTIKENLKKVEKSLNYDQHGKVMGTTLKMLGKVGIHTKMNPETVTEALNEVFTKSAQAVEEQLTAVKNLESEVNAGYDTIGQFLEDERAAQTDYSAVAEALVGLNASYEEIEADIANEKDALKLNELRQRRAELKEQMNEKAGKLEEFKFAQESNGLAAEKTSELIEVMIEELATQRQILTTAKLELEKLAREIPLAGAAREAQLRAADVITLTTHAQETVNMVEADVIKGVGLSKERLEAMKTLMIAGDQKIIEAARARNDLSRKEHEAAMLDALDEVAGLKTKTDEELAVEAKEKNLASKGSGSSENHLQRKIGKINWGN
jgi:hypothetical protein